MTPQQYHLTEGPKLRDALQAAQDAAYEKRDAAERHLILNAAKAAGIRLPAAAKAHKKYRHSDNNCWEIGGVQIEITVLDGADGPAYRDAQNDYQRAAKRRKALCKTLNVGGSNQFAAFCKTKYGRDLNEATLKRAHSEWLDLISCDC